jgi:hypothetical protein
MNAKLYVLVLVLLSKPPIGLVWPDYGGEPVPVYFVCALIMDVSRSAGLQPLAKSNSQGHDQGFLAIPFIEELRMWGDCIITGEST